MNLKMMLPQLNPQGIEIVHVVAMDRARCIGKGNDLPWHIPADLQHFKALTQGGVVLMGRKTLESMRRALPNRSNWVITRDATWQFAGVNVAHTLQDGLVGALADVIARGQNRLFIIGGGEIFSQTIDIADRLELTHVDLDVQGDAFYPEIPAHFDCVAREAHVDDKNSDNKSPIAFEFSSYQAESASNL